MDKQLLNIVFRQFNITPFLNRSNYLGGKNKF